MHCPVRVLPLPFQIEVAFMSSRRVLKAANAIRQVVSMAILTELRDPRVKDVTVTSVEVTPDMRQARVNVSIMGDEKSQNLALRGLQNAAGFLQAKIIERIDTRYTPKLEFKLDTGVKNSIAVARILDEVLPRERAAEESADEADFPRDASAQENAAEGPGTMEESADPNP